MKGHLSVWRCCLLVVLILGSLTASRHCYQNHYWDSDVRRCRPCTKCDNNDIIHIPCGTLTDTVCRPFTEFSFNRFKQPEVAADPAYTSYESIFSENSSERESSRDFHTGGLHNEPMVEKDDGEYWKNLAFALIGVVCVLIFVATIVVLMACRKLHENAAIKRPEEEDDDDSGYVVIRAIRPPYTLSRSPPTFNDFTSAAAATALLAQEDEEAPPVYSAGYLAKTSLRQDVRGSIKGAYKPKRRLLNYDADDVFESEDSSGSRTSRKAPLQPIPERSVSSDTDSVLAPDEVCV